MKNQDVFIAKIASPDFEGMKKRAEESNRIIDIYYNSLAEDIPLVGSWEELQNFKSDTHELEVDLYYGNAWIRNKETDKDYYLSTHTFYESQHKFSTKLLNECGFKVKLESWG